MLRLGTRISLPLPFTVLMLVMLVPGTSSAAPERLHSQWVREHYSKTELMIPMRDGIRLYTAVYAPRDRSLEFPILLFRTPYSAGQYGSDSYRPLLGPSAEFDRAGYLFVFQDVRGKFRSEGEFEVIRPLASRQRGRLDTDESTDNYDTIEWLLRNLDGHSGRVGQWGISYAGWQTVLGLVEHHPALRAASPQSPPADMFIGDDWHHNGAFRIMYAFSWLAGNARRRDGPTDQRPEAFDYGTPWGHEFFLRAGSAANIDEMFFGGEVPAWREFMRHPDHDEYWQSQNVLANLRDIDLLVLNVAGWFDTEDFYGPIATYHAIEGANPGIENTLVVGPWLHGGWRSMDGDHLGCVDFSSKTSHTFQQEVQLPFFEHHLRGVGEWGAPEAMVFVTGANEWRRHHRWPPAGIEPRALYLHAGGRLEFRLPDVEDGPDRYVSDPDRPVPFSTELRTTLGDPWKVEDQRFASTRPDVLVYESDVLDEDLTIAGPILANMFVSTTGTDSDWVVKLIDVYPDDAPDSDTCDVRMGGYQMHLAGEVMRGRYRNGLSKPEAMVAGEITPIVIDLRDRYHTFKVGHRIMVQVQRSWFPAYDRNPQSFVDIYHARAEDYQVAKQAVFRSAEYPSHLVLGVLDAR